MPGKTGDRRRRGWQSMSWLDGITNTMDMTLNKLQEDSEGQGSLACCSPWGHRVRHDWATEQPHQINILSTNLFKVICTEKKTEALNQRSSKTEINLHLWYILHHLKWTFHISNMHATYNLTHAMTRICSAVMWALSKVAHASKTAVTPRLRMAS